MNIALTYTVIPSTTSTQSHQDHYLEATYGTVTYTRHGKNLIEALNLLSEILASDYAGLSGAGFNNLTTDAQNLVLVLGGKSA